MEWNALTIGVGVFALALFLFAFRSSKVKKDTVGNTSKTWVVGGSVILAVGLLWMGGYGTFVSDDLTSPLATTIVQDNGGGNNGNTGNSNFCQVEDTTVTISALDKYTSSAAGGTHRYRVNNGPAKTVADAGTFTASPGDELSILYYNASTSGGYFSDIATESIPCVGTVEFTGSLQNNGTVTIQVWNEEDFVIDGTTYNETLAAGDTVTLNAEIKGTYKKGMPYGGILIAEFNTSEIDDVIVDFGDTTAVAVSGSLHTIAATDHTFKAYKVPAMESNQKLQGTIYIDADDTINPGSADDIDLKLYQYNYFINEDNGGAFELGVEDEDNSAVQPTNVITATLATD